MSVCMGFPPPRSQLPMYDHFTLNQRTLVFLLQNTVFNQNAANESQTKRGFAGDCHTNNFCECVRVIRQSPRITYDLQHGGGDGSLDV